ncbi:tRNA (adenosine(37)-N6)-threonylcarbamoyltransferase complex ATPase subunit type 1 TsaE, partial [[Ruminococcus] lactaris]|uniref:tRNA (adenosine(37)-N6)-threonylcarbamoyltransferase complex ATPase subunit type 1 TsaE n=1 Tax=[Ruminococcus] lactaris TaxID=46228 RepID=UPI0023AF17D7
MPQCPVTLWIYQFIEIRLFRGQQFSCLESVNAKGLGIEEPVNSPTFTIVQVYEGGRLPFYHFD